MGDLFVPLLVCCIFFACIAYCCKKKNGGSVLGLRGTPGVTITTHTMTTGVPNPNPPYPIDITHQIPYSGPPQPGFNIVQSTGYPYPGVPPPMGNPHLGAAPYPNVTPASNMGPSFITSPSAPTNGDAQPPSYYEATRQVPSAMVKQPAYNPHH